MEFLLLHEVIKTPLNQQDPANSVLRIWGKGYKEGKIYGGKGFRVPCVFTWTLVLRSTLHGQYIFVEEILTCPVLWHWSSSRTPPVCKSILSFLEKE